ncbi:MAG: hypothetical protein R3A11_04640 [Bdellovibrionota bacterium]
MHLEWHKDVEGHLMECNISYYEVSPGELVQIVNIEHDSCFAVDK